MSFGIPPERDTPACRRVIWSKSGNGANVLQEAISQSFELSKLRNKNKSVAAIVPFIYKNNILCAHSAQGLGSCLAEFPSEAVEAKELINAGTHDGFGISGALRKEPHGLPHKISLPFFENSGTDRSECAVVDF